MELLLYKEQYEQKKNNYVIEKEVFIYNVICFLGSWFLVQCKGFVLWRFYQVKIRKFGGRSWREYFCRVEGEGFGGEEESNLGGKMIK